jgi:hypothetical protein
MRMKQHLVFLLTMLPIFIMAEGGKNLTPANTGTANGANQYIGYLQNGDANNSLSFLAAPTEPGFNADHRLLIRIKPGEIVYYGIQRNDVNGGILSDNDTVIIILRRIDNGVIVRSDTLTSGTLPALDAGSGVISSYAAMVAGPAAVAGAGGYNALAYTFPGSETNATDLAVEILDDGPVGSIRASAQRDFYNLWDFSVYSGTTEKKGRLHAKYWSFNANGVPNRLSTSFQLYTAVPNQSGNNFYIKSINLSGMQPFGFFFTSNATGTLKDPAGVLTSDYKKRRKSRNFYTGVFGDGYPQYDNFVADPDPEFWPTSAITNPVILPVSKCNTGRANGGAMDVSFTVSAPGVAIILLDLNNTDGYQPGTKDVLIETEVTAAGTTIVSWDGLDGLGANVPSGTAFKTIFRYGSFPVHYPIYDAENNSDGFAIFDERPSPPSTPAIAFWDDSSIIAGSAELFGVTSTGAVHPWGGSGTGINTAGIGDTKLMNTWVYGQLREFKNTYLHTYGCVSLPPVANNFSNLPMSQTNGATAIPALTASDPDGTISSYTITSVPAAAEGVLTYCSNATEPCTGTVTPVTAGTVLTPAQAGTLKFDPAAAFSGTAQFTFTATDNSGNISNTATYKLPVTAAPPVSNNIMVPSMANTNGPTLIDPLSSSDEDGTIASYTITTIPSAAAGVLSYCSNGTEPCTGAVTAITAGTVLTPAQINTLKFDPVAGFTGNAVFNYSATDNSGNISNTANYTIPVAAAANGQTPPLVNNINAQPVNNSNGPAAIPGLQASDLDGSVVSYTIISIPPVGEGVLSYCPLAPAACTPAQLVPAAAGQSLTPAQAASVYFDPAPGFTGTVSFTYTAIDNDGNAGNTGNYTIPVSNNPPTATNVTTTVPFNAAATSIPSISGSDGDGTVTQYTVTTIPTPAQGVLYYCPSAPGACTLAQLVAVTAGLNLTPAQANALFFDPAAGFSGTIAFIYTATDNNGNVSQPANYTISIANQPPVAQTITLPVMPNTNGQTAIQPFIAADPDGTISSYTVHTIPPLSEGVLSLNGVPVTQGQVLTPAEISQLEFDPAAAFTGVSSFAYSATDNSGNPSNLAFYNIPVSGTGNIPPVAEPVTAPAINSNAGQTAIPVLTGSDPDGTVASYTIETLPPAFQGVLLLNGAAVTEGQSLSPAQINQLQFTPAVDFTGNAGFQYSVTDNSGAKSNFADYTIPVFNLPPVANPIVAPAMPNANGATAIPSLLATDADGTVSSYTISTLPLAGQGILLLNGSPVTAGQVLSPVQISQLQFDPSAGYTGEVLFNYFATDNTNKISNVATYTLYVTGVPPISKDVVAPAIVNTSGPTSIPALNSTDADGSIATYKIHSIPPASQGVLLLNGVPVTAGQVLTPAQIGQLQFDPAAGFNGNAMFNYSAVDNGGNRSNTACYVIPVIPVSVVPVILVSFNGKLSGGKALLNWSTSQEINSDYFDVQRSLDGISYQSIGTVAAAGNSSVPHQYQFTDNNTAAGVNFYRLKIMDKDGSFENSPIVLVRNMESAKIRTWPNPFTDKIQVNLLQQKNGNLQVSISDASGKILRKINIPVTRGNNQFTVDQLNSLSSGVYFMEIKDNTTSERSVIKVIK